jgi:outer membrane protein
MVRVAQAYFDVLASQDNLETVRTQKKAIAEQLAAAKRNFEVGTATITDQQEAQSRADLVNAQEIVAENDLVTKLAALSTLTGKPVQPLASLRQGIILAPPEPADVNSWTSGARDFNLNVSQAKIALEIAKREIDKQRYGHYPTVDLVASLQRSENPAVNFLGLRSNSAALGVQLNVPIYAGGAITARVRQAIAARDKSMTDLENAQRNVTQAARAQFLGVSSGLAQVKALEAAEKSSQLALDSNQLGYQVGVRINIDVLNAQQQLFTTRRDLAKARYDVLTNGLKLKQTAGTLKEEDLQALDAFLVAK